MSQRPDMNLIGDDGSGEDQLANVSKPLSRLITQLSRDEFLALQRLATAHHSFVRHDLMSRVMVASGGGRLAQKALQGVIASPQFGVLPVDTRDALTSAHRFLGMASRAVEDMSRHIDLMLPRFVVDDSHDNMLISRPAAILTQIACGLTGKNFELHADSDHELELLFPSGVLASILAELVTNAFRHGPLSPRVITRWRMIEHTFACEVHDSGPGFPQTTEHSFCSLEALRMPAPPSSVRAGRCGLSLVNRLVVISGGGLFFSRSTLLGGALVSFKIPVHSFSNAETEHERFEES